MTRVNSKTVIIVTINILLLASLGSCKAFFKDQYNENKLDDIWKAPTDIEVEPFEIILQGEDLSIDKQGEYVCAVREDIAHLVEPKWACWGMEAREEHKYYAISTDQFDYTFDADKDNIYVQFISDIISPVAVGNGTLALLPEGFDQDTFNKDTPYWLKFGPKKYASNTTIHLEITWKGKRGIWKLNKKPPADETAHLYRFNLNQDGTYGVHVDWHPFAEGKVEEDFDFVDLEEPISNIIWGAGFETYMVGNMITNGYVLIADEEDDTFEYGEYIHQHIIQRNYYYADADGRARGFDSVDTEVIRDDL